MPDTTVNDAAAVMAQHEREVAAAATIRALRLQAEAKAITPDSIGQIRYLALRCAEAEQRLATVAAAESQAVRQLADLEIRCSRCRDLTGEFLDLYDHARLTTALESSPVDWPAVRKHAHMDELCFACGEKA